MKSTLVVLCVGSGLLAGCSNATGTPVNTCVPNRAEVCACADGRIGSQTCNADRTTFSDCVCVDTCTATTCSAHGTCALNGSTPTCSCFGAYSGTHCEKCAPGAVDLEGDGSCALPTCTATSCSGHGTCAVAQGVVTCTCFAAYQGTTCTACAPGFDDLTGSGTCEMQACTRDQCNGHGSCSVGDAGLGCTCFAAYTGESCLTCAPGFQDHDGDGTCEPACTASTCTGHGVCVDARGAPQCTCQAGYQGGSCSGCAAGFQDKNGDGVCSPDCTQAALSCGALATCSDETGTAGCTCLQGYVASGTQATGQLRCVWAGVVGDPAFTFTPAVWAVAADAGVDVTTPAFGQRDVGLMTVDQQSVLKPNLVSQPVTLPATDIPWGYEANFTDGVGLIVRLDREAVQLTSNSSLRDTITGCFGDRLRAGAQTLTLSSAQLTTAYASGPLQLDHFEIRPAPECPLPGQVKNGNFESAGGWVISGGDIGPVSSGSYGLHFSFGPCTFGQATTKVSIPSAEQMPAAAMSVRTRFTSTLGGQRSLSLSAGFEGAALALTPGATWASTSQCVPPSLRGKVVNFVINGGAQGDCAAAPGTMELEFDDATLVSDPACVVRDGFIDPGFEAGSAQWQLFSGATRAATSHLGWYSMQLNPVSVCDFPTARQLMRVPMPVAGAGPALKLFYTAQTSQAKFSVSVGATSKQLPNASNWTQGMLCIPPAMGGLATWVTISNIGPGGVCANTMAGQTANVDDLALTTDPSCPWQ